MSSSSTRHRIALVIASLGLVVSSVILYEELQLANVPGYSAFCNLGGVVNCDVVLSSRYGTFLDVPLGVWALVTFMLGIVAAFPGTRREAPVGILDLLLIALASGPPGFSPGRAGHHRRVLRLPVPRLRPGIPRPPRDAGPPHGRAARLPELPARQLVQRGLAARAPPRRLPGRARRRMRAPAEPVLGVPRPV